MHPLLGNTGLSATADAYRPTVQRLAFQLPRAQSVAVSRVCARQTMTEKAFSRELADRLRRSYARCDAAKPNARGALDTAIAGTCRPRTVMTRTSFYYFFFFCKPFSGSGNCLATTVSQTIHVPKIKVGWNSSVGSPALQYLFLIPSNISQAHCFALGGA